MYYYNPITKQYAKVLGVDSETGFAIVVINDKTVTMAWDDFISQFNTLTKDKADEYFSKNW